MSSKKKGTKKIYYAVTVGRKVGVFDDWLVAKRQVSGFPNNAYKGYDSLEDAERAFKAAMKGNERHVVLEGHSTGVFKTMEEAVNAVDGHPNAYYFKVKDEKTANILYNSYQERERYQEELERAKELQKVQEEQWLDESVWEIGDGEKLNLSPNFKQNVRRSTSTPKKTLDSAFDTHNNGESSSKPEQDTTSDEPPAKKKKLLGTNSSSQDNNQQEDLLKPFVSPVTLDLGDMSHLGFQEEEVGGSSENSMATTTSSQANNDWLDVSRDENILDESDWNYDDRI